METKKYKLDKVALSVLAVLSINFQAQAAQEDDLEVISVTGVRGAQESAVAFKKTTAEFVDGIAAEDIGKLPDVTIADSLQRVTGIQIERSAGQGSSVSIRGMPQVSTTLNGERFMSGETLLRSRANFTDIPASLLAGVNVYKSASAQILDGGIGGSIDLKTRRSLDLDEGLSTFVSTKVSSGSLVDDEGYEVSGMLGYNSNDRVAASIAFNYSDATLANNRANLRPQLMGEGAGWQCGGPANCADINADGDMEDTFYFGGAWNSDIMKSEFDRERVGVAINLDAKLTDEIKFIADIFYNDMEEFDNGQKFMFAEGAARAGAGRYTQRTGLPAIINAGEATNSNRSFYAKEWKADLATSRAGSDSELRTADSLNTNLELEYLNNSGLQASLRYVHGEANRDSQLLRFTSSTKARPYPKTSGGEAVYPNAAATTDKGPIFETHTRVNADNVYHMMDPAYAALIANPEAWAIESSWLEGEFTEAEQDVLRTDFKFNLANDITAISFGLRYGKRSVDHSDSDYFSPSGFSNAAGDPLYSKFKDPGYPIRKANDPDWTTAGQLAADHDLIPTYAHDDNKLNGYIVEVSDFGAASSGFNATIPMIDVSKMKNAVAFTDYLYGKGIWSENPDRSYKVEEQQISAYFQMDFETDLTDSVYLSGNSGFRFVRTILDVTKNLIEDQVRNPALLAGSDVNHGGYADLGDEVTKVARNYVLPSFNLNFNFEDDWKIKFAYNETISLQDLQELGRGSVTFYQSVIEGEDFQRVSNVNNGGNPHLEPWHSRNWNLAFEWYPTDTSLVSVGLFSMEIESFVFNETVQDDTLVDNDGVARLGGPVSTRTNGEGGTLQGIELAYQQSFDFLPGILANTGTTINYTHSPSEHPAQVMPNGEKSPLVNTAENQANAIFWYQGDKLQARIAVNYVDDQFVDLFDHWTLQATNPDASGGMSRWKKASTYIDLSTSYKLTDSIELTGAVQNLTEEGETRYVEWESNVYQIDAFERRLTLGVNAKF